MLSETIASVLCWFFFFSSLFSDLILEEDFEKSFSKTQLSRIMNNLVLNETWEKHAK